MKCFPLLAFLIGCIASLSYPCSAQQAVKRVAIMKVIDKSGTLGDGIKLLVRGYMTDAVTNNPGYEGYDRVDIAAIMNEQEFQRTGMVSDAQIKKLGEMTGADYILLLEMAKLDADNLVFTSKILEVESAHIFSSATVSGRNSVSEYEATCQKLSNKLLGGTRGGLYGNSGGNNSGSNGVSGYGAQASSLNYTEKAFGINMQMVWVEGGSFLMGCTSEQGSDCEDDEKNVHRVTLDGYYIGKFEVTQGQWQKVMGTNPSYFKKGDNYPVENINWKDATAFCEELSRRTGKKYRLPTEAQWEYAARRGNRNDAPTKYSGSYSIDAVAWYNGNSGHSTQPVGTKRDNLLGIHDMSGNVYEWCSDFYGLYGDSPVVNPQGASSGSSRVIRGGSWLEGARYCRVSYRYYYRPDNSYTTVGFRVVCEP